MEPLASALPATLRRLLRHSEMSQGKLEFAWRTAVGPAIERATVVRLTDEGILEVRASDAAWKRELHHSHGTILRRLQDLLGTEAVKSMRIVGRSGART